jgi:nucleoside-diphosphate-sugar epimerase
MPLRLIFGCGYLGLRAACRWRAAGDAVLAVTRSAQRAPLLQQLGLQPLVADVTRPETLAHLPAADTVLFAVAPDRASGASPDEVVVGGLGNVLRALVPRSGRLVYISTTGVYGDHQGGWVDETTPCEPSREGGRRYLRAESLLRTHAAERLQAGAESVEWVILRLAGIYGPQRIPNLGQLAVGEPIAAWPERFLNLIHVDDAVEAIHRAASHERPSPLYLVSDGHPVRRREFYQHVAMLWHTPAPRFAEPEAAARSAADAAPQRAGITRPHGASRVVVQVPAGSVPECAPPDATAANSAAEPVSVLGAGPGGTSRQASADDRRIDNRLMVHELGVRLRYPSYREGLAAIRAQESTGN